MQNKEITPLQATTPLQNDEITHFPLLYDNIGNATIARFILISVKSIVLVYDAKYQLINKDILLKSTYNVDYTIKYSDLNNKYDKYYITLKDKAKQVNHVKFAQKGLICQELLKGSYISMNEAMAILKKQTPLLLQIKYILNNYHTEYNKIANDVVCLTEELTKKTKQRCLEEISVEIKKKINKIFNHMSIIMDNIYKINEELLDFI